jgi:hypothetical protein
MVAALPAREDDTGDTHGPRLTAPAAVRQP